MTQTTLPHYAPTDAVDFVIVGAGSAGGVVARELSRNGFRVVLLEQGPYLHEADFKHDEVLSFVRHGLTNNAALQPQTFRARATDTAQPRLFNVYGRLVGGGSVHFTANYWRFHEIDFIERSKVGAVAGTGFDDWPITYADLEPYYTKVEWEVGVSGLAGASPFDPPRSKPYPLPPLPIKPSGVLMEVAARKLGWTAFPAPLAVLSQPYRGRAACQHCGFCEWFGCEYGAKSSTLASMIPDAAATGRCEIRPESYARKVEIDRRGRVSGVIYFDATRREVFQRAKAVVLCANGAETPRLLLMSKSNLFPHGLANSNGIVGKYLMLNGGAVAGGLYDHELNGHKSVQVSRIVHDFYTLDPKLGLIGGGGIDTRFDWYPVGFATDGLPPDLPKWGAAYKRSLRHYFTRSMYAFGHTTSLPLETNSISLDPQLKDAWGLPVIRTTFQEHPQDLRVYKFFLDRILELLQAAGARRTWSFGLEAPFALHLLGTCRMGKNARASVIDPSHRAHDVRNLFIVDGSSFVTGGRGQPTMTIQALAFRASDEITTLARSGALR